MFLYTYISTAYTVPISSIQKRLGAFEIFVYWGNFIFKGLDIQYIM